MYPSSVELDAVVLLTTSVLVLLDDGIVTTSVLVDETVDVTGTTLDEKLLV